MPLRHVTTTLLALGLAAAPTVAAPLAAQSAAVVDSAGVLRWRGTGAEVALFGVNYAAPFAYDYRALGRLGADRKAAIDADVAHLTRLGVDAFRVHVWDREVSDSLGNLLRAPQLDLFDYLLWRLDQRGIRVVLTPIAWWGTGYPEADPPEPGFSARFPKAAMGRDPRALAPQQRYLQQFVGHVNPYTRKAYGADPNIIAIELFNEPHHDGMSGPAITAYVDALAQAVRAGGATQPIVYNVSEHYRAAQAAAVCAARIDGVSAQWYPTGLVRGAMLVHNVLPNVDRYEAPFTREPACATKARFIYEFDAADVMSPLMYPAMARSFRAAGFQWATQFAYDPLALAHTNTAYQTHFLNLAYTPAKAISLLIAGEVFRRLPRGVETAAYPANTIMAWPGGMAKIDSASGGVGVLLTDTLFAYAGTTAAGAPAVGQLRHLAGVGNSYLVSYSGSGAYFLDKLAPGVWRLEVMPDVEPVVDPFSAGTLARAVSRIVHRAQRMQIRLPELAGGVRVRPLDRGNRWAPPGMSASFAVKPGVYLLTTDRANPAAFVPTRALRGGQLGEYFAPAPTPDSLVARARADIRRAVLRDSAREAWAERVPAARTSLFDAGRDFARVVTPGYMEGVQYRSELVPAYNDVPFAWRTAVDAFGDVAAHVAFRSVVPRSLTPRSLTTRGDTLVITARASVDAPVEIALVQTDGVAWGTTVRFTDAVRDVKVALRDLRRMPLVLLPRPYPTYQPYDVTVGGDAPLDLAKFEGIQVGIPRAPGRVVVELTRVRVR